MTSSMLRRVQIFSRAHFVSQSLHRISQRMRQYLTSHGIRKGLKFDPEGRHGEALFTRGESHREFLRWLHKSHDYIP